MENIIQEAKKVIDQKYDKSKHQVGCALITKSGKIYVGISIRGQKINTCGEWHALSNAFLAGDYDIEMGVAVQKFEDGTFEILPPCGLCREFYITYCPNAEIIVSENQKIKASELISYPWVKSKKK
ncbi:MAG: Cytidine deaminase family enzyme [Parcubacteria group bacterium GW2011_GWF1_40_6]|uniref:Cytidine deaminase family enzyme n=2 Tax=Candidatus Nomuraibacteriota TaxID=1752729 RepID=A0A0G0QZQ6_9BACT|nr:MAG: Cytidine deaminase family enzyme [Candidatus Nomurabacteria bacterium GW2011_GWF2_40_12]KKR69563.1 MAG: Cytidine deaminase family enzyme [Parcubacteria group bacterium GW2011_GWF1_40_6]OGJ09779.1 MAG: hypothetical protein A2356_02070 [Candidatus Nomurabacteria bacterium RIFOXYB1_FULL_39_16]OGJ15293.1 MAG: hypothetical protein A2585_03095 [Candidatus Nomurabacteria bacterium RIFOXYD1_FULL_39_12]